MFLFCVVGFGQLKQYFDNILRITHEGLPESNMCLIKLMTGAGKFKTALILLIGKHHLLSVGTGSLSTIEKQNSLDIMYNIIPIQLLVNLKRGQETCKHEVLLILCKCQGMIVIHKLCTLTSRNCGEYRFCLHLMTLKSL